MFKNVLYWFKRYFCLFVSQWAHSTQLHSIFPSELEVSSGALKISLGESSELTPLPRLYKMLWDKFVHVPSVKRRRTRFILFSMSEKQNTRNRTRSRIESYCAVRTRGNWVFHVIKIKSFERKMCFVFFFTNNLNQTEK